MMAISRYAPKRCAPISIAIAQRRLFFATGYYDIPNYLDVPGEDLPKVIHYYKRRTPITTTTFWLWARRTRRPLRALELFWTGARVTLVHRGAGISNSVKYWIKPNIENRIKNGEIKAYFHSRVKEIRLTTWCSRRPTAKS